MRVFNVEIFDSRFNFISCGTVNNPEYALDYLALEPNTVKVPKIEGQEVITASKGNYIRMMSNNEEIKNQTTEQVVETNEKVQSKPVKAEKVKTKKVKEHKVGKFNKTISELKKVTWPSFGTVVKQTSVVLVVVLAFLLVIFGLDRLCSWLVGLICS